MQHIMERRHFLRGVGALVALPKLESIGFCRFASTSNKSSVKPPKRSVFLSIGFGVTKETWFPDQATTGIEYQLSEGLSPLTRHQSDITVVQHRLSGLTGSN